MYTKLKIFFILLTNIILIECLKCKKYNYDYYYVNEINTKNSSNTEFSTKIIIDNKIFYINKQDYDTLMYMGSAKLKNGKYINILKNKTFYTKYNYAVGSYNNRLDPWISISSSNYKYGTKVYIKEFANKNIMVNNKNITHNGCFRIDDKNNDDDCFIEIFTNENVYNNNITNNDIDIKINNSCLLKEYY